MRYYRFHVGRLVFRTGRVVLSDAAFTSSAMFVLPPGTAGDFYSIDEPCDQAWAREIAPGIKVGDIAALEIRFAPSVDGGDRIRKIGCVGVDSAQIIIADEQDLLDCVPDPLFITESDGDGVATQLIDAHSLVTQRLADGWIEAITDAREEMHRQLSEYITSNNLGDPEELLFYKRWGDEEFGPYDRVQWGEDEVPMISLGKSCLFNFSPNGSDGQYDVFAEFAGETMLRCWIVIHDAFFTDGKPSSNIEDVTLPPGTEL